MGSGYIVTARTEVRPLRKAIQLALFTLFAADVVLVRLEDGSQVEWEGVGIC
jgi:phosphopantothenate synthetase